VTIVKNHQNQREGGCRVAVQSGPCRRNAYSGFLWLGFNFFHPQSPGNVHPIYNQHEARPKHPVTKETLR